MGERESKHACWEHVGGTLQEDVEVWGSVGCFLSLLRHPRKQGGVVK